MGFIDNEIFCLEEKLKKWKNINKTLEKIKEKYPAAYPAKINNSVYFILDDLSQNENSTIKIVKGRSYDHSHSLKIISSLHDKDLNIKLYSSTPSVYSSKKRTFNFDYTYKKLKINKPDIHEKFFSDSKQLNKIHQIIIDAVINKIKYESKYKSIYSGNSFFALTSDSYEFEYFNDKISTCYLFL